MTQVTAPGGVVTKYGYDLAGNLVSRTDADNNAWSYSYDGDNRLSKTTGPLGNTVSYQYDGDGNQVLFTDARGMTAGSAHATYSRDRGCDFGRDAGFVRADTDLGVLFPDGVGGVQGWFHFAS